MAQRNKDRTLGNLCFETKIEVETKSGSPKSSLGARKFFRQFPLDTLPDHLLTSMLLVIPVYAGIRQKS